MNTHLWQWAPLLIFAFILLFPLIKFLLMPLKVIVKLIVNGLLGLVILWLVNTVAGPANFFLPINIVTIIVVGLLGIPGVLLIAIFKYFIMV
ncbi:MAG: pro-sigmaK processing inhibitor BofA family protein [Bacillota bacterium]|jgi:inhibitor of the pro-sigma K processing machinery